MKSIETEYKGYLFRSRLEATWAVFFDELKIRWEYEVEGFDFENGIKYLPDFWLPTFDGGSYAEIKAFEFTEEEIGKCKLLNSGTGKKVMMCIGKPDFKCINYYCWDESTKKHHLVCGIPNADQADGDDRMYIEPGYQNSDLTISEEYHCCLGTIFTNAVLASRKYKYRFK